MGKLYLDFETAPHGAVDDLAKTLGQAGNPLFDAHMNAPDHAIKIAVVNLMPTPKDPIRDFGLLFANHARHDVQLLNFSPTPDLIRTDKDAIAERRKFLVLSDIADYEPDAVLITGYGVEKKPFEELRFWSEIVDTLNFAEHNNLPVLASCWGSHAALYRHHGVARTCDMTDKISGVFEQKVVMPQHHLMQGIDSTFTMPVSRNGRSDELAIETNPVLQILACSQETGSSIVSDGRVLYLTGHPEYKANALALEYQRDKENQVAHLKVPKNTYPDNDPNNGYLPESWRANAGKLTSNWVDSVAARKEQTAGKVLIFTTSGPQQVMG